VVRPIPPLRGSPSSVFALSPTGGEEYEVFFILVFAKLFASNFVCDDASHATLRAAGASAEGANRLPFQRPTLSVATPNNNPIQSYVFAEQIIKVGSKMR